MTKNIRGTSNSKAFFFFFSCQCFTVKADDSGESVILVII